MAKNRLPLASVDLKRYMREPYHPPMSASRRTLLVRPSTGARIRASLAEKLEKFNQRANAPRSAPPQPKQSAVSRFMGAVKRLFSRKAALLAFALLPLACGDGGPVGPGPTPTPAPAPLVVYVDGPAEVPVSLAVGELNRILAGVATVVQGRGPRQIWVTIDDAEVERVYPGASGRSQGACTCTGEGFIFLKARFAGHAPLLLHELGHLFGLPHSELREELMYPTIPQDIGKRFSPREEAAIRRAAGADRDSEGYL